MNRLVQGILIVSVIVGSWLGMQAVHELGHVLGAWLTGGRVAKVVLYPLTISRTDLASNPHPLLVVWAGPMIGVVLPLLLWGTAARWRMPGAFVLRFFAGFCLIANGVYLAAGSFDRIGDCETMLRHGSSAWQLWLFGAITVPAGLWLWHRQGPDFGLGPARGQVRAGVALASMAACILLLVLGFVVNGE
jgi:hypothetical protein